MEKYIFDEYTTSEYSTDPVFETKKYILFGNPGSTKDEPDLFLIHYDSKTFSYCLVEPRKIRKNKELLLKTKRYILYFENLKKNDDMHNTYFIGDMEKSADVSSDFYNQNIILVTYEMIEQWYPKNLSEIFKIIIKTLIAKQKYLGERFNFRSISEDTLFVNPSLSDGEKNEYVMYLMKCMEEERLISIINDGLHIDYFVLTAKAMSFVDETKQETNKDAFIAIKFDGNEERINAIQNAIALAGFEPKIMNQVETNGWIMPEIFYQIKNSKFVVADFSLPCNGAYYEAGYAAALDKPVIHLFDKREESETNKLHFDIAQKSTIFYENYDDLKERLTNRIKATIRWLFICITYLVQRHY